MTEETSKNRDEIIKAWDTLMDVISDWERGRVEEEEVKQAHRRYALECRELNEAFFSVGDVVSDDMEAIPVDYPQMLPNLPVRGGAYDTPYTQKRRETIARNLGKE